MEISFTPGAVCFTAYATATLTKQKAHFTCEATKTRRSAILTHENNTFHGDHAIARYLARVVNSELYPADVISATHVEQWLGFALGNISSSKAAAALDHLNASLRTRTFLAGYRLTLADVGVWAALIDAGVAPTDAHPHVARWFAMLSSNTAFKMVVGKAGDLERRAIGVAEKAEAEAAKAAKAAAAAAKEAKKSKKGGKKGGKKGAAGAGAGAGAPVADGPTPEGDAAILGRQIKGLSTTGYPPLEGAVMGQVVTRFPPEPSGYLHIGHVKAVLLNWFYARRYKGTLLLRFDDTNPSKEKTEFADAITEDLARLGIKPDKVSHTSDHFALFADYARKFIKDGNAFMDNTEQEQMREERMNRINSANRDTPVERNLELFELMMAGDAKAEGYCLRAKMDMSSNNATLRDPVMYRSNATPHLRTGKQWKAYPTYDFACPIVDSIEGVTHAMRTTEYADRDAQYYWIIKALGLRPVKIQAFARLNFQYTLMSKRKLQWLVDENQVEGWYDPRFPTIQGIVRRGLTIEALRAFILAQGFSRTIVTMEWDKFWSVNAKVLDADSARYMAVVKETAVPLTITNFEGSDPIALQVVKHPKDKSMGMKTVFCAPTVWVEGGDVNTLNPEGEEVTLMRWGNVIIDTIERNEAGAPVACSGRFNPEGDYKKTKKLTWVAQTPHTATVKLVEFDHLLTCKKLEDGANFVDFLTTNDHPTRVETEAWANAEVRQLDQFKTVQFERRGYFRCDEAAQGDAPGTFFLVPDGKQKAMSTLSTKLEHR